MSLTFDELLTGDNDIDFPDLSSDDPSSPARALLEGHRKSSSPLTRLSSTTSTSHDSPPPQHDENSIAITAPSIEEAAIKTDQAPPSSLSLDIDPDLLDATFEEPVALDSATQRELRKINAQIPTIPDIGSSPSDWLTSDALPFQLSTPMQEPSVSRHQSSSPLKRENLAKRWQIDTSTPASSGPSSAVSQISSLPFGDQPYSPADSAGYASEANPMVGPLATKGKAGVPPPKKKSHARKQPEGHIKRARNAFILFRKHVTDSGLIPPSVEVKHQNISVVAAKMWREAPQEVRQKFQEQARLEKEEHQRLYPGYRYQPVFRRTDIIRRRVRKDAAEDEKVEAVAEALINGKAGEELEKEIEEQIGPLAPAASESVTQPARPTSRRRRRDQGQLSKGAIRAQRAQARAKQMRQNLLGTNLLSISMYNAAQQQAQQHQRAMAQAMPYGMEHGYLPVGYDIDGRPLVDPGYHVQYGADAYGEDTYRLPPIVGYEGPGGWDNSYVDAYYGVADAAGEYYTDGAHGPGVGGYSGVGMDGHGGIPYSLPPLDLSGIAGPSHIAAELEDDQGEDPRMRWTAGEQQTPSGHVVFNERLFDGALGSAMLGERREEDGLGSFEEAVAQAGELRW